MPKPSLHALTWSKELQRYELYTQGRLDRSFHLKHEQPWHNWLSAQRSFAFQGQHGRISVVKEVRARGNGYWYAYSTRKGQTRKRYLGQTSSVTLEELEHIAQQFAYEQQEYATQHPSTHRGIVSTTIKAASGHNPLIAGKHTQPQLPATLVTRERLLQEIDRVLTRRLLILSSSAGSGKTTLLSTWAARSELYSAWLSLDEDDNEPTRFWTLVITSLSSLMPEMGTMAMTMLTTPQPPPRSTILTACINEMRHCASEIILILDDYQNIENQEIQQEMHFLLDHLPENMHLIIASRIDPPLPLARLRMHDQVVEIRELAVRFTTEETRAFLNQRMSRELSENDVHTLEKQTEGWVAGLQLAALTLRTQTRPTAQHVSGEHRFLFDYVQEEILQQLEPGLQQFLLQIAIPARINAALCQELTGETQSQDILETLERNNLFIVPLDGQRQWYRLHTLFREVLLAHLHANQPERVQFLQQRAAHWYAEQGAIHESITYALAAQNYVFVCLTLEEKATQLLTQGEVRTVANWLEQIPEQFIGEHLDLILKTALKVHINAQYMPEQQWTQAMAQCDRLIARIQRVLSQERDSTITQAERTKLTNRITLIHEFTLMGEALRKGQMQQLRHIAQRLQSITNEELVAWKWLVLHGLFISSQFVGDSVLFLPALLQLKEQAMQEQDYVIATLATCWVAAAFLYAGQLHAMKRECLLAQDLRSQLGQNARVAAYPAFDLSFFYYAWNQLEQAEENLQAALHHAACWQDSNLLIWGHAIHVKIALKLGKVNEAEKALEQAQELVSSTGLTTYIHEVTAARVKLWLAQENITAADYWARQYIFDPQALNVLCMEEYMALACVHITRERYQQSLEILHPLIQAMEGLQRNWDIIHLLALQAIALYGIQETEQALNVVTRLLKITESEGYIRLYLDAGTTMRHLLQLLLKNHVRQELSPTCTGYISMLLTAFVQEEQNSIQKTRKQLREKDTTQTLNRPYEPLSIQEQRVLERLVAGDTYAEIAEKLIVSPNTIKTQVSSIYRKLNVTRRAEAIAITTRLHLL